MKTMILKSLHLGAKAVVVLTISLVCQCLQAGDLQAFRKANMQESRGECRKAIDGYKKLASHGFGEANGRLGDLFYDGSCAAQDYAAAATWYESVPLASDLTGYKNRLGYMYQNGQGVSRDTTKAVELYKWAAENGNQFAQFNMGSCLENGTGMERNYLSAAEWYRLSAEQGNSDAAERLTYLKAQMGPSELEQLTTFEQTREQLLADAQAQAEAEATPEEEDAGDDQPSGFAAILGAISDGLQQSGNRQIIRRPAQVQAYQNQNRGTALTSAVRCSPPSTWDTTTKTCIDKH